MSEPLKTFIIYARADEAHKRKIILHLRPLVNSNLLKVWYDGDIMPGEDWEKAIKTQLKSSDLVLLLVSANSLSSEFIQNDELKTALERLQEGTTRVVPILVAPCGWRFDPILRGLQMLPLYGAQGPKAVADDAWHNEDQAWANVVESLGAMIEEVNAHRAEMERLALEHAKQEREAREEQERRRIASESAARSEAERRARLEQEAAERKKQEAATTYVVQKRREEHPLQGGKPTVSWIKYVGAGSVISVLALAIWFATRSGEKNDFQASQSPQNAASQNDSSSRIGEMKNNPAKSINNDLGKPTSTLKTNSGKISPDSVIARHILIKDLGPAGEHTIDSLKNLLEKRKVSFGALARKYSQDYGSALRGGDLGWFAKGTMVQEFNDLCFYEAAQGKIYKIKTAFGWHLVEVTGKKFLTTSIN